MKILQNVAEKRMFQNIWEISIIWMFQKQKHLICFRKFKKISDNFPDYESNKIILPEPEPQ